MQFIEFDRILQYRNYGNIQENRKITTGHFSTHGRKGLRVKPINFLRRNIQSREIST
uniref:Uncharacterized protein n=1 Tax=Rhizophora mucronata TaxID=61149 RepID=A0A2P2N3A8_RHIMU